MRERMYASKTFADIRRCCFQIERSLQIEPVLRRLAECAAEQQRQFRCHWPHPSPALAGGKADDAVQLDVLLDWAPDEKARERILADNPAALYGFSRG